MGGTSKPIIPLSGQQRLQLRAGPKSLSCATALVISGSEGANKAVGHVAPSLKAQKASALTSLSPLLLSLAQSSSSIRYRLGGSISLGSQPTVKRQRLDDNTNLMAPGTSAAAAIPIDDEANDDDKDDDDIKILIEEGDDNDNEVAIANVDARGNVYVGTSHLTNAADSSGFGLFILLDRDKSAVADIKG